MYSNNLWDVTVKFVKCSVAASFLPRTHRYAHKYSVECVQWYPFDTGLFITSAMDKRLKLWDSNRMKPVETFHFEGRVYQHHLSTAPAKQCLIAVASSINQVQLVDVRSGSSTHELRGHNAQALCCKWSPREEYLLATGSCDNRVLMWDVRAARSCLRSLDQHNGRARTLNDRSCIAHNGYVNALCFTQDGLFLMSLGTDNRMRLWDACTGRNELANYGRIPNATRKGVRFDVAAGTTPDFVYVPSEGNVLVYEVHTGTKLGTLLGHYNTVNCCCYNPFYHELYSGASDRNILVWSADGDQKLAYDEQKSSEPGAFKHLGRGDNWSSDDD